eukprot:2456065-Pyramimonas_sp.AAC.1
MGSNGAAHMCAAQPFGIFWSSTERSQTSSSSKGPTGVIRSSTGPRQMRAGFSGVRWVRMSFSGAHRCPMYFNAAL